MSAAHKLFGAYDIRGIYGEALNESFAELLGNAFGKYISPDRQARILVGYDSRTHSPSLADALTRGLVAEGHEVVLLGIASTPMVSWYGAIHGFDASISVTASHLAKDFNGFKIYRGQAEPVGSRNGLREIEQMLQSIKEKRNGNGHVREARAGKATRISGYEVYAEFLRGLMNPSRPMKVAIDVGHGAAAPEIAELILDTPNIDFLVIAGDADGTFPSRSPNPLDEGALAALSQLVVAEKCDFGVALDGDADRAIFVDDRGEMIETDLMIGLVGGDLVKRSGGGAVVYDLRSSRSVPEYVELSGGLPIRTGVGTMFIKSNMQEHRAVFAGELSGHYYYGDMFDTDNALRTMIEVVNLVSRGTQSLSELVYPLSKYSTSGEINLRVSEIEQVLRHLDEAITDGAKEHIDGLSVNYPQWWFAVRGSQTEPVLRLTVGAVNKEILEEQTKHLIGVINDIQTVRH